MTFSPSRLAITEITQANPCVVFTSTDHNMTTGQVVRMHVPKNYGMVPLNQNIYSITILTADSFSLQVTQVPTAVNVDSRDYPAFVISDNPQFTAEVLAVGAGPTPITNTECQIQNNTCQSLVDDATTNVNNRENLI